MPVELPPGLTAAAKDYILGRQCQNGGFCFYRNPDLEEPNLSDTWCAIQGLQLLGCELPERRKHIDWLESAPLEAINPEVWHDWVHCRIALAPGWMPASHIVARVRELPCFTGADAELEPNAVSMRHAMRWIRLQQTFGFSPETVWIKGWLSPPASGGYGRKPNLEETALAVQLMRLSNVAGPFDAVSGFVDRCQSPSHGFINTTDSTHCRLPVILAGVRCCHWLELPIRYPQRLVSALLASQRQDGAFADVPGALPDLESHFHGLHLLRCLQTMGIVSTPPQQQTR